MNTREKLGLIALSIGMAIPQLAAAKITETGIISGAMSCNITSLEVISSEEGIPKSYARYRDSVSKDDSLILEYSYNTEMASFYMGLKNATKDSIVANSISRNLNTTDTVAGFPVLKKYDSYFSINTRQTNVSLGNDSIYFRNSISGQFYAKRYYKGDWDGIYTSNVIRGTEVEVFTFNCRTLDDEIDAILEAIREIK